MASQCKSQQCTIDRRGFRQELDSWRHKLVHCVGFESILEGLFGPELVDDPALFKDFEPTAVSDWSFDENCLFCCLRRDKVKEHLIGLSNKELKDSPKPLLIKDPTAISRLEKQAEEFLNAVLSRKDVPNFSDPHIPVVAREILHRMIRQFAAEYTSKTSSPQDSGSDSQPCFDQSLPPAALLSRADPPTSPSAPPLAAHNQNPVLSKLLMADQDAPLDLTIKRPPAVPRDQDGVLDLSIRKSRCSSTSSLPVRSPCLSPASSTLKGEPHDMPIAKARDLQSASSLEQFMAKLCPHHQRQIIDAIGFLQTEVKALASSKTPQASRPTSGIQVTACSTAKSNAVTSESSCAERLFPSASTPKSEVQRTSRPIQSSCALKLVPENAVSLKTSAGPVLDLRSPGSGSRHALVNPTAVEAENTCGGDHAPLKMKIMTSNVAAGKKLSCVLNTSLSSHPDSLEDRQGNSNPSHRTETHSARLSSSVKRHNQTSHVHPARPRETLGPSKDKPASLFSVHMTIPSDSPRTARKTIKSSSDPRIRDAACRGIADPDLGHCDIVFIDKPITECFKEQRRGMQPRRNARKSTRGHMYSDEIWELKTVRTLAPRGKCPNPLPELITLVTPKQVLSKPEGLPPVKVPFAGACREFRNQRMSTEGLAESAIPGTGDAVEVAASAVDLPVETSQTDQSQGKGQSAPPSPIRPPAVNQNTDLNTDVEGDSGTGAEREESVAQAPFGAEQDDEPELQEDVRQSNGRLVPDKVVEPLQDISVEEDDPQLSSVEVQSGKAALHLSTAPSPVAQVEEEKEEKNPEQTQEVQPESPWHGDNFEVAVEANATGSAQEPTGRETEMKTSAGVEGVLPSENEDDTEEDVSSKTLDSLLKELPPWRRKKGTVVSLPTRLRKAAAVVVGFVNGRPISASDRSLRRRSSHSTTSPNKTPVKAGRNVPGKNSAESTVDNRSSENHPPESDRAVQSTESTSVVQQVNEPSSAIPPNPKSKSPPKNKQRKAPTGQDSLPEHSDQRQLRSASQKPAGAPPSPPNSISSPQPTADEDHPSTEQPHALPCPSPLTGAPAPIRSSSPAASEKSQQQAVPETTESNIERAPPVETSFEEIQKNTVETRLQAGQNWQSANIVVDDSRNEHPDQELSSPLENQSPSKAEMQSPPMPLRSKRVLLKEAEASDVALLQKPNVAFLESTSACGDEGSSLLSEKPKRMPLRSESSKVEMCHQSPAANAKKSALRSQRPAVASTSAFALDERQSNVTSPLKIIPERVTKAQVKAPPVSVAPVLPRTAATPVIPPRAEPPRPANKFFQALTSEENQHLITNLNLKFDKMQKGWVQMDKEGQPAAKYKNKADRQAAIWKSKRRARKSKSSENQKYSPVQMLFMKGFNLSSICRWFLDTTETKSLVIVKKVNTRLPSETQLCFHSSSSGSGTSQGVFPSLQAERLKKHLKKFAIASPVKSNPRSQKLIAKALEHEAKERGEQPSATQAPTKAPPSAKACVQMVESQKASGKSKNPASARILRKYSNIREKMQVQQTNVRLKEASSSSKGNGMKRLAAKKSAAKSNLRPPLRAKKSSLPAGKRMNASAAKMVRRKTLAGKKTPKHPAERRAVRASRVDLPKRSSQRLGSPKTPDRGPPDASRSKADNKKPTEAERPEVEKPAGNKANAGKLQAKEPPHSAHPEAKVPEGAVGPQPGGGALEAPQVLTRAQRKMNVAPKRAAKSQGPSRKAARRSEEPAMTRRGAAAARRRPVASAPRAATKRARERSQTPAKRARTALSK